MSSARIEATAAPESVPRRRSDELLSMLADRIGAHFGASSVFGAPVERDGVTVIPVASVRFGLGGGAGTDPGKGQEGEGAGAGGTMSAAGYIELKQGRTRFVGVVHPERMAALACLIVVAALLSRRPAAAPRRAFSPPWR